MKWNDDGEIGSAEQFWWDWVKIGPECRSSGLCRNAIRACVHPAALLPSFGINVCTFLEDPPLSQWQVIWVQPSPWAMWPQPGQSTCSIPLGTVVQGWTHDPTGPLGSVMGSWFALARKSPLRRGEGGPALQLPSCHRMKSQGRKPLLRNGNWAIMAVYQLLDPAVPEAVLDISCTGGNKFPFVFKLAWAAFLSFVIQRILTNAVTKSFSLISLAGIFKTLQILKQFFSKIVPQGWVCSNQYSTG